MTAQQLLQTCRRAGITLVADGDYIDINAPVGALTRELRDELARHKPELLALLAPVTKFVTLNGGLIVPLPAVLLALDLERREFRMSLDPDRQFQIQPTAELTEADLAAIARWRLHLGAVIGYDADATGTQ